MISLLFVIGAWSIQLHIGHHIYHTVANSPDGCDGMLLSLLNATIFTLHFYSATRIKHMEMEALDNGKQ
jgi:hypothetical protein